MKQLLIATLLATLLASACTEDDGSSRTSGEQRAYDADVRTFGLKEEQLRGVQVLDPDDKPIGRVADQFQDMPGRVRYLLVEITSGDNPRRVYIPIEEMEAVPREGQVAIRTYLTKEEIGALPGG
jgi:hypothetical protein